MRRDVGRWLLLGCLACVSACGCGKSASNLFRRENPNKAAEERWKRVRAGVKHKLAESQLRGGHLDEALREVQEALALDGESAAGYTLLARIRLEQGQGAAAREAAREAVARGPGDAEAAYVAGLIAERSERWEEAEQEYARAFAAAPQEPEYLAARAEAMVALGRSIEALDLVEASADRFIDDPRLRCLAGQIYRQLGMSSAAADRFEQAARADNDNPDVKLELGLALSAAGRDVEAVGILTLLVDEGAGGGVSRGGDTALGVAEPGGLKPAAREGSKAHVVALARSLHRLGRFDEARRRLEPLMREAKNDGAAWLLLARVAVDLRDWRTARQAAEQAVRLRGDEAEPHLIAAYVCVQQKDYDAAVQAARMAIQRDARDATGYCLLGEAYAGRGETALAHDAYFEALARDPQSALARALLSAATPTRTESPKSTNDKSRCEGDAERGVGPGGLKPAAQEAAGTPALALGGRTQCASNGGPLP